MLKKKITMLLGVSLACVCMAYAQEQKPPTPEELAQKETERLENSLKLEDWQVFYVDSTLNYNYSHLMAELEDLRRSRVENSDIYFTVQDKWMEATEAAYKKYFTPEQWAAYLKQGGQRIINDRQKRRDQAAGIKPEKTAKAPKPAKAPKAAKPTKPNKEK